MDHYTKYFMVLFQLHRMAITRNTAIFLLVAFNVRGTNAPGKYSIRTDSRFAFSQWETPLLCNDVSHWLCATIESTLFSSLDTAYGLCDVLWKLWGLIEVHFLWGLSFGVWYSDVLQNIRQYITSFGCFRTNEIHQTLISQCPNASRSDGIAWWSKAKRVFQ